MILPYVLPPDPQATNIALPLIWGSAGGIVLGWLVLAPLRAWLSERRERREKEERKAARAAARKRQEVEEGDE